MAPGRRNTKGKENAVVPETADPNVTSANDVLLTNCAVQLNRIVEEHAPARKRSVSVSSDDPNKPHLDATATANGKSSSKKKKVEDSTSTCNEYIVSNFPRIVDERTFLAAITCYISKIGKPDKETQELEQLTLKEKFTRNLYNVLNEYNIFPSARLDLIYNIADFVPEPERKWKYFMKKASNHFNQMFPNFLKLASNQAINNYLTECIIDKGQCPSSNVLLGLFTHILNLRPETAHDTRSLQCLIELMDLILRDNPPNSRSMTDYYKEVLIIPTITIDEQTTGNGKLGIFYFTIKTLKDELSDKRPIGPIIQSKNTNSLEYKAEKAVNSVLSVEQISQTVLPQEDNLISKYEALNKNERIHRLFIVLNIIVKILEADLAIFLHDAKQERLIYSIDKPIICELLWSNANERNKQGGVMNTPIKVMIKLFAEAVKFKLSVEYSLTLSKLLSMIVHAVHLYENNPDRQYPFVGKLAKDLFTEISNALKDLKSDVILNALQLLKPAHMKYFIVTKILLKGTNKVIKGIDSIYDIVQTLHRADQIAFCIDEDLRKKAMKLLYNLLYHATTAFVEGKKIHELDHKLIEELLMHYQIKSELRAEARRGAPVTMSLTQHEGNNADSSREEVEMSFTEANSEEQTPRVFMYLSSMQMKKYYENCKVLRSFANFGRTILNETSS